MSERWKGFKMGDVKRCDACGLEIVFYGQNWDHSGENKPRHIAHPVGWTIGGSHAYPTTGAAPPSTIDTPMIDIYDRAQIALIKGVKGLKEHHTREVSDIRRLLWLVIDAAGGEVTINDLAMRLYDPKTAVITKTSDHDPTGERMIRVVLTATREASDAA